MGIKRVKNEKKSGKNEKNKKYKRRKEINLFLRNKKNQKILNYSINSRT